jgi:hypothetical protein
MLKLKATVTSEDGKQQVSHQHATTFHLHLDHSTIQQISLASNPADEVKTNLAVNTKALNALSALSEKRDELAKRLIGVEPTAPSTANATPLRTRNHSDVTLRPDYLAARFVTPNTQHQHTTPKPNTQHPQYFH